MNDLLADFVIESREGLSEVESQLLAIESAGQHADREMVNQLFRSIHSIKGASGFLGLTALGEVAHEFESVLAMLREGELVPHRQDFEVMLAASDVLQSMIDDIENSNDRDVADIAAALRAIGSVPESTDGVSSPETETDVADFCLSEADRDRFAAEGKSIFELHLRPQSEGEFLRSPSEYVDRLNDLGDIVWSQVDLDQLRSTSKDQAPESLVIRIGTILDAEVLSTFLQLESDQVRPCCELDDPLPAAPEAEPPVEPVKQTSTNLSQQESGAGNQSRATQETSLRVGVSVLNRLMNLAGELVLGRNQLLQIVNTGDRRNLAAVATRIDNVTSELQATAMQTRLQPIGNVFGKFNRIVRDLSSRLGKRCDLLIEGQDVEMDKTIIESIGDPLTHLIRNAVDHGMETPEERASNGKSQTGKIELRAFHREGKVNIVIRDDGRGINCNRIRQKAIECELLTEEQAADMPDSEVVNLIFHPGLSTAEKVSEVSGRGVGMDVVRTNFESLGGSIEIGTAIGKGTTFTVRLPLTLAIIPSLIVSADANRYAIPQAGIDELVRIRSNEWDERIESVQGATLLRLRGSLVPLTQVPGSEEKCSHGAINIVVMSIGQLRFGLVVDQFFETEEIVVKPLGRHLKDVGWLSGATILGDGQVALILDSAGLANLANIRVGDSARQTLANDEEHSTDRFNVLLMTNETDHQFAIPLEVVSRIEQVRASDVEHIDGQTFLQYREGMLPLIPMSVALTSQLDAASKHVFIVVCNAGDREVGLIASEVHDTCMITSEIDSNVLQSPGVLGTLIINEKTTRLMDVFGLARATFPAAFGREEVVGSTESVPRIVLAEDSRFFRERLKGFLSEEGWDVVDFEDGQQAWEYVSTTDEPFGLVLTDIEMPEMDGFELCERIRTVAGMTEVPIVAVTSLADDESLERSSEVGMTQHLVKLDRAQLIETVSKYLKPVLQGAASP